MRVAILLRCLAMMHGGGETRHLAWARELRRAGDAVTVITGRPLVAPARYSLDPAVVVLRSPYARDLVYRFQRTRGLGRLLARALRADEEWFCRAAWRWIAQSPTPLDIVHAHALPAAARLRRGRIPTVINLPGMADPRDVADLQLADAIVADGYAADHLPAVLGRSVEHVPKGVDVETFRPDGPRCRPDGTAGKSIALVVSRLVPIKNVGLAIAAMARLRQQHADLVLVVAGDGPSRPALEAQAGSLAIADRVIFAGSVPHDQMSAWYRAADVFVLPSEFDNSPNVVLEAMASGLPVVATDVGGVGHYVRSGVNGELAAAGDAAALAAAIGRYLSDPALRARVARRNREDAVAGFSWAQSARMLRAVYERVIAASGAPPAARYRASA